MRYLDADTRIDQSGMQPVGGIAVSYSILLADPSWLVRAGLRAALGSRPDLAIVAEASDGGEAVREALRVRPDLAIIEIRAPGIDGVEVIRRVARQQRYPRFLALSEHLRSDYARDALRAGALGYIRKDAPPSELLAAIDAVAVGQVYVDPELADPGEPRDEAGENGARLSRRQQEVLQLLSEGCSNEEMGRRLGVSARTIGSHRAELMRKLDLHSVAGLVRYAIREGMVAP